MDYEKKGKEFYELMKKKADEIESLDISEDERNNLYQLVDGIIQRYVKMQIISLRNTLCIARLNESQIKIYQALEEIISTTKVTLSNLEEIVKKQRENKNILSFSGIPFSLN